MSISLTALNIALNGMITINGATTIIGASTLPVLSGSKLVIT